MQVTTIGLDLAKHVFQVHGGRRGGRGYVPALTSGQRLGFVPAKTWLAKVRPSGWRRLSADDGAKGPRLYDWALANG